MDYFCLMVDKLKKKNKQKTVILVSTCAFQFTDPDLTL